jgi:hypothetical protein
MNTTKSIVATLALLGLFATPAAADYKFVGFPAGPGLPTVDGYLIRMHDVDDLTNEVGVKLIDDEKHNVWVELDDDETFSFKVWTMLGLSGVDPNHATREDIVSTTTEACVLADIDRDGFVKDEDEDAVLECYADYNGTFTDQNDEEQSCNRADLDDDQAVLGSDIGLVFGCYGKGNPVWRDAWICTDAYPFCVWNEGAS